MVKCLLEHGAHVEFILNLETALHQAAKGGSADVASLLIERGALVDEGAHKGPNRTPLRAAVEHGHEAVARLLLTYGANPNLPIFPSLLVRAVQNNFVSIGTLRPFHPFACFRASSNPNRRAARLLIEFGARVNVESSDHKEIPLYVAVSRGHPEMVTLLLHHGADLNHRPRSVPYFSKASLWLLTPFLVCCFSYADRNGPSVVDMTMTLDHPAILTALLAHQRLTEEKRSRPS